MVWQRVPAEERFWAKVTKEPGCWLWTGARTRKGEGYGRFALRHYLPERTVWVGAHRFSYELAHGPIPEGMQIDHLCDNPGCVNPAHLRVATARENTLRSNNVCARNARKTHCQHGHEFTPENTIKRVDGRACRECSRAASRRHYRLHGRPRR